jgi:hypothetical protein
MSAPYDHPNDPGRWTLIEARPGATLWRREREDPMPVTMFYLLAPPAQPQVLYDAERAMILLDAVSAPVPAETSGVS